MDLALHIDSSDATKVSWTKVKAFNARRVKTREKSWWSTHTADVLLFGQDNVKLNKEPNFSKVSFSDSGRYECDVTMGLLSQKATFELVVEGKCGYLDSLVCLWRVINGFNLKKSFSFKGLFRVGCVWHVCLLLNNNNTDAEHNVREDEGIKSQEYGKASVNDTFSVLVEKLCTASVSNIISLIDILRYVCRNH